jgi:tetratricopeptide (TPR) repeat protein
MKDPYQVLGVSPSATDEEIKDAYRALVKKYHPDKFADSDLAELANEKMKDINSAYDEIQKMRSGGSQSRNTYGSSYGGSNYGGGFNPGSSSSSEFYTRIRQLINTGNTFEAEQMLLSTPAANRNGEWYYLYACVMVKKGYYADAQRYFDMACDFDPNNVEYKNARDDFRARSQNNTAYRTYQSSSCCDLDCCTSLICADCCCECMGGDLIGCC